MFQQPRTATVQPPQSGPPYFCSVTGCKRSVNYDPPNPFSRNNELKRHERTQHNIGEPELYWCEHKICRENRNLRLSSEPFKRKDNLKQHYMDNVHNGDIPENSVVHKRYVASYCEYEDCPEDKNQEGGGRPYAREAYLRKHYEKVHDNVIPPNSVLHKL